MGRKRPSSANEPADPNHLARARTQVHNRYRDSGRTNASERRHCVSTLVYGGRVLKTDAYGKDDNDAWRKSTRKMKAKVDSISGWEW